MQARELALDDGSSPLTRGKPARAGVRDRPGRLIPAHAGKTVLAAARPAEYKAHPRSRGENFFITVPLFSPPGSSPLTRGKRGACGWPAGRARLIPAHAGKTDAVHESAEAARAHPRSRGENEIARAEDVNSNGSSPLTRGKLIPTLPDPLDRGLIPAHAGKTDAVHESAEAARAHPRSRGENTVKGELKFRDEGSSPLTRGKPRTHAPHDRQSRLIPAHAGKTLPTG